jgi:fluoride exporter
MLRTLICIALGGSIGSVLRYLTAVLLQKYYTTVFPLATFLVNVIGCLLIGVIMGLLEKNQLTNTNIKWLLVTGFCGGFTTFSAFSFENISLLQNGYYGWAFFYITSSIVLGIGGVWLGLTLLK